MPKKLMVKLLGLTLRATSLLPAADNAEMPASEPWVETLTVLILSFGIAAFAGYLIDLWFRTRDKTRPGVDAYIDQMVAGNGPSLRRPEAKAAAGHGRLP